MPQPKPAYTFIHTQTGWYTCLEQLQSAPRLAVDLESNSLYAYREKVCLIQLSTATYHVILDPLASLDLTPLGELLADPAVEKVFHAAEYDLILMDRDYGWQVHNLFDTMWAARILGMARLGLASILEELFDVQLDKRHQRANWCQRPLTPSQLEYAHLDTAYLLRLRDYLDGLLKAGGHEEEAAEIFAAQTQVRAPDTTFSPDGFWSLPGVPQMSPTQQGVVRALYIYRDQQAQKQNRPPFKVFSNDVLLTLAQLEPQDVLDLQDVPGLSRHLVRRYGHQLLRIVAIGREAPPPRRPSPSPRPPDDVYLRYEKLHDWRKQAAQRRGVASDVIMSREALWELAYAKPRTLADLETIPGLGPWRRQTYGPALLKLLSGRL